MNDVDTTLVWLVSKRGKIPRQQSRTLRRRLKKLDHAVKRVTKADDLFFERHPHRQYRVRLTSRAEIERQGLDEGRPMTVPSGCRMFTVMRNIAPRFRLCLFIPNLEGADVDLGEAEAREVFNWGAVPYRPAEARMMLLAGVAA